MRGRNLSDRVLGSATRTEAVGTRLEVRLEDRLEHQFQRSLHDPVTSSRNPQRPDLARCLGSVFCRTGNDTNPPAFRSSRTPANRSIAAQPTPRGVTPSTPAVRAPLFPRTRCHATTKKAGLSRAGSDGGSGVSRVRWSRLTGF